MEKTVSITSNFTLEKNNLLKLFALLVMTIDHIGAILYPDVIIYRLIGRLAFPIFAFLVSEGAIYTKDIKKYLIRLLIFGVISQPIYSIVFNTTRLNIFFTLTFGLLAILITQKASKIASVCFMLLITYFNISYGVYGVAVIYTFYIFKGKYIKLFTVITILTMFYVAQYQTNVQYLSLLIIPVLYFIEKVNLNIKTITLRKHYFYFYYSLHLFAIYFIKELIK